VFLLIISFAPSEPLENGKGARSFSRYLFRRRRLGSVAR